jgi:site-specific DNA-adenine methylase
MDAYLKAPFPYFGGKAKVADAIWGYLGNVRHYIEPFFGSGAVLLSRPGYSPNDHVETVCDKDGFVSNVWRSLQLKPDEVARWADWPVNHVDLSARRNELIQSKEALREGLLSNAEWCDPKLAGYWIWAASAWIGSGLTTPSKKASIGQIPQVSNQVMVIHATGKRPNIAHGGKGVHSAGSRPQLSNSGGVHSVGLRAGNEPREAVQDPYNTNLYEWFRILSERLRYVRVVCGDWSRVCGGNWQHKIGLCGVFFDPPYPSTDRKSDLYAEDSHDVGNEVAQWVLARGDNPSYRIVVAGYEGEHQCLLDAGWQTVTWKANGGYSNQNSVENKNRFRETLFLSPYCERTTDGQ